MRSCRAGCRRSSRRKARRLGLGAALVSRVILLFSLSWILGLTQPVFHLTDLGVPESWVASAHPAPAAAPAAESGVHVDTAEFHDVNGISWRDIILLVGGLFLIGKSVTRFTTRSKGRPAGHGCAGQVSWVSVLVQIAMLDIVFSLDSVITAVGMAKESG